MERKVYRAKLHRALCAECETNIRRGMPVVYVDGKPIHANCETLANLRIAGERVAAEARAQ
jgi:hypothetical protein